MHAIAANQAIEAFLDRLHGIAGFDQYPHLNHVSGFPVVAGGFKARGDDHTVGVFMENKSVHREPPTIGAIDRSKALGTGRSVSTYRACDLYL
jgi:hypothetical protein